MALVSLPVVPAALALSPVVFSSLSTYSHPTCALCRGRLSVDCTYSSCGRWSAACPCASSVEDCPDLVERWHEVYTFEPYVGVRRLACRPCSQSRERRQQFTFRAVQHRDGSCRCLPPVGDCDEDV